MIRKLECGLDVVSFYRYDEIEYLIKTKYEPVGYYVFNIFANQTFKAFAKSYNGQKVFALPIDDSPKKHGYSHTAILAKSLKSRLIEPLYNSIRARNSITYAGMTREFRFSNPRNFLVKKQNENVILVDDIITTGATLSEAYYALDCKVDFAIVLCDA